MAKYQGLLDSKDSIYNDLQRKFDEQANSLKSAVFILFSFRFIS